MTVQLLVDSSDGKDEISLLETDFKGDSDIKQIYDTRAVMCGIIGGEKSEPRVLIKSIGGSCGASLLGRFCHLDHSINDLVKHIAEFETKSKPDYIIAEISHLPESRIGNIASRPQFRDYVIHYLSGCDDREREIPLSDLMLSVKNGKLQLRSKRYNKIVIPKLTCAHNYSMSTIPVYHFLCDLQFLEPMVIPTLTHNDILNDQDYLPRIVYKNIILECQRWVIREEDLKHAYSFSGTELLSQISAFRQERKICRYVTISEFDNTLLIDLDDELSVKLMLTYLKKYKAIFFEEFLFEKDDLIVKGKDGGYVNEFIFVLHKYGR